MILPKNAGKAKRNAGRPLQDQLSQRGWAQRYVRKGWTPIPVPLREKGPKIRNWQQFKVRSEADLNIFAMPCNVGLLNGEPSGNLVDVDIDCPEAREIADEFLPQTAMIHGRKGNPSSHRWYKTLTNLKTTKFAEANGTTLLEIRSTGSMTLVQPSIHPSGEPVCWEQFGAPAEVDGSELSAHVARLAACTLVARHWPEKGNRNEAAMALAGFLLRGGMPESDVERFIQRAAKAAADEEWADRGRGVGNTKRKIEEGKPATGGKRLVELLKDAGAEIPDRLANWLGLRRETQVDEEFLRTDRGNARRLILAHKGDLLYAETLGLMVWDGTRYTQNDTGQAERWAKDVAKAILQEISGVQDLDKRKEAFKWACQCENQTRINQMLESARSEIEVACRAEDFDRDPWLLNVNNGTIDLRGGELRDHRQADRITKLVPVNFDPDADCPIFDKFLFEIMGGRTQLADFLQRAVGYSLTGETAEQCFFILYGTGANGKSTLVSTLSNLLGNYAVRTPVDTLETKNRPQIPNDLARLRGARFVYASESEDKSQFSESRIKDMTGGERIPARFLHREWFEFAPEFKLWLSTNHKPIIKGTDHAIWRRIRLIPFDVAIPEEQQDKALKERLLAELSGILAWAVKGCLRWQTEGLAPPSEVLNATQAYRGEMDLIGRFLADCCESKQDGWTSATLLYAAYVWWCKKNGEEVGSQTYFGSRMTERGGERGNDSKTKRVTYKGIVVKTDVVNAVVSSGGA